MNLFVVGRGREAAVKLVHKVVRETVRRSLIVDHRGLPAALLSADDVEALHTRETVWVNLADIRNPVRVLEFQTDERGLDAMERVVWGWARVLQRPLLVGDTASLVRFCRTVFRAGAGEYGAGEAPWLTFADLRSSLANTEVARWAWPPSTDSGSARRARVRVLDILDAALRYAHVAALTVARSSLRREDVASAGVVWFEIPARYLETVEWKLISIAVLARLRGLVGDGGDESALRTNPLPVLLHPPAAALDPFLNTARPFGEPAAVALRRHPSGAPPALLRSLRAREVPFAVEFSVPDAAKARRAWKSLVAISLPHKKDEEGAVAFRVAREGSKRIPEQILTSDVSAEASDEGLDELRRRDAQGRARLLAVNAGLHVGGRANVDVTDTSYERLSRLSTLRIAWSSLRLSSSTGVGLDGVTPRTFAAGLEEELADLSHKLSQDTYQPLPVRWVTLPKRSGGSRRIGITALRDRVVQRAFLDIVEPYFESHFSDHSYGFRSHRGAHHAVAAVLSAWSRGRTLAVRLDIESCFDTLPHELILSRFAERVPSPRMLALLGRWLRTGTGHVALAGLPGVGVVQGYVLAPFLSNLVLSELDEALEEAGLEFARYADDLTLLVDSSEAAQDAIALVTSVLKTQMRMRLNARKTRVAPLSDGVDFLGFRVAGPGALAMATERYQETRRELAMRRVPQEPVQADAWLKRLHLQLEGFANYFCRLGMTRALEHQFANLLKTARDLSAQVPKAVATLPGWSALPDVAALKQRHGGFDAGYVRRTNSRSLDTHPYVTLESREASQWVLSMAIESAEDAASPPSRRTSLRGEDTKEEDEAGIELDGRTVVLFEERASLQARGEGFSLVRSGKALREIRYADVDMVVIESPSLSLSARAAWALAQHGLPAVLAGPNGDQIAVLAPPSHNRGFIRVAQAQKLETDEVRRAGVSMLAAKVANQASLLRYLARAPGRRKTSLGEKLNEASSEIRRLSRRLAEEGEARLATPQESLSPVLMGYEGRAAAIYWQTLAHLVPKELLFPGRRTRGATDALNMALNYVYGILYADVWRAVVAAGLDPGIGIVHRSPRSNGGLVFDIIEELRAALADRVVLGLLGRGWQPLCIDSEAGALRKKDCRTLARAYLSKRRSQLRRGRHTLKRGELPRRQAEEFRALILGQKTHYKAFRFRW